MNFNHDTGTIDTFLTIDTTETPPLGGAVNSLYVLGTGAIALPFGTTAQEPGSPVAGMIRYNTDTNTLEFYNGATFSWKAALTNSTGVTSITGTANQIYPLGPSVGDVTLSLPQSIATTSTPTFAQVTVSNAPVAGTDTVNLTYLQAFEAGLEWKIEAVAATVEDLSSGGDANNSNNGTVIYNNGAGTITSGTNIALEIDGQTISTVGQRVLVKNQTGITSPTNIANGIYQLSVPGNGSTAWVLTRVIDADTSTKLNNATLFITTGLTNENSAWTQTTPNPVLGTDPIVFVQNSGAGTYTAGTGLTLTGNQFSLTTPVSQTNGGTGTSTAPTAGQILIGTTGGTYTPATIGSGTGINVASSSGAITISNTGVTSVAAGTGISVNASTGAVTVTNTGILSVSGTTNEITASTVSGAVTLSIPSTFIAPGTAEITSTLQLDSTSANSFIYTDGSKIVASSTPTNGQLLIGSTGATPVTSTLTAGTGISITNGAGSITIASTSAVEQLYRENPSTPTTPVATGTNSVAIGSGATASATNSYSNGDGTGNQQWGSKAFANGKFTNAGDAEYMIMVIRNQTTDATVTELFLDGTAATQRMVLPNNSVWNFHIQISARRTNATGDGAGFTVDGVIKKDTTVASTTLVGSPSISNLGRTDGSWKVSAVTADTVNGSLKVTIQGAAGKNVNWVGTVTVTQTTN